MTTAQHSITRMSLDDAIDMAAQQAAAQFLTGRKLAPTVALMGPPGCGKTGMVFTLAQRISYLMNQYLPATERLNADGSDIYTHGFNLLGVHFMDIGGSDVPEPSTKTLDRYEPSEMVLPNKSIRDAYRHIIIFVDEIDKGPDENRQAISPLLLDNELGLFDLPEDKYFVIAAGNDTASQSGGNPLFMHNIERINLVHVNAPLRGWLDNYARDADNKLPPMAPAFVADPLYIGLFANPAPLPTTPNTPHLSLRTFTNAVRALPYLLPLGLDPRTIDPTDPAIFDRILSPDMRPRAEQALAGIMGSGAATQYLNYAQYYHLLPTRAEVESNPATAKLPRYDQDPSAVHAAAAYARSWLSLAVASPTNLNPVKLTRAQLDAYGTYMTRFDATRRVELMFAAAKMVPAFTLTKAYSAFIADPANQALAQVVMSRR